MHYSQKRVLITGGAGFIGSRTALKLLKRGCEVTVLDNLSSQIHGDNPETSYTFKLIKDKVRLIHGDVRNSADWEIALKGQDAVFHLAAETGTGQSMYEISRYSAVNVHGTSLLLDHLVNSNHSVKKMVVASSRSIYGEGKYRCVEHNIVYPDPRREEDMARGDFAVKCPVCQADVEPVATDEDSPPKPSSVYSITKVAQEQLMLTIGRSINVPVVALRYQNVYGPGQSLANPYTGILSIFSSALFNGEKINVFEDGMESRDFVFIDDVVETNIRAIEREDVEYCAINVGTGVSTSVLEVVDTLSSFYDIGSNVRVTGNFRCGDIRHNFADITRLEKLLGYSPRYSFAEGIELFSEWVINEHREVAQTEDLYHASIVEMRRKGLLK
jgi:dTDP-L-rhamnose 4-epimerase